MPSLSDKLKSLGIKVGATDLPKAAPVHRYEIDSVVTGAYHPTPAGETFVAEQTFDAEYRHGHAAIQPGVPFEALAAWAREPRFRELPLEAYAFLDTETSGLAGGTGTYAFLVGVGRFMSPDSETDKRMGTDSSTDFEADKRIGTDLVAYSVADSRTETGSSTDSVADLRIEADSSTDKRMVFRLQQFFMRDPAEEAALLEGLAEFLAPCQALVTFNGKGFDAPLLITRYSLHNIPCPFGDFAHLDLLPLARRLWRDRLPSRALKYLEENVLSAPRTTEEVPGYEIPYLYFDYLHTGDARPLKGVFYHNTMDVVAMAALLSHVAAILDDPFSELVEHGLDVVALAKFFEDLGQWERAARLFERGLEMDPSTGLRRERSGERSGQALPEADFWLALERLSRLQKRRGDLETAVRLWERAAAQGHIYAHVELAKYHEHQRRDYPEALKWAHSAVELVGTLDIPRYMYNHWMEELEHRKKRLDGKLRK
jgi:uncharacterized protein YprB with RNaseH-like and TPR domain